MDGTVLHFCFWLLVCLESIHAYESDNDKCQWGACDQKCVSRGDSYSCHCEIGWKLHNDGRSCNPENGEALMIFSTKNSIQGYWLSSMKNFTIAEKLQYAVGVSFYAGYTYWSDIQEKTISRSSLYNGTKREVIIMAGLGSVEDIAVDWVTGNIYFTDYHNKNIGVCDNSGYFCKVLINEDTDELRGIAIIPSRGKMYWTDFGAKPHIAVSYMDGSKKELFIQDRLVWPSDLTIDFLNNRLYWVDMQFGRIECINLDGTDRRIILEDATKIPFSIAVFGNSLYWSDWNTTSIHSCNKFTGKNRTTPVQLEDRPYGIHIYHSTLYAKQDNPCALKPCSQLCLLAENQTYTCACSTGSELGMDRHTCRDLTKRKHVAIAAGNALVTYYHAELGRSINVIPNVTAHYISALTYDPLKDTLIAVDVVAHSIFRYDLQSDQIDRMNFKVTENVEYIAFDYLGNNLYMSIDKKIEIHDLNTNEKTEFSYPESPLDMVLIPEEGMMFVVFRSYESLHIDRVQMNGLGLREHVVERGLVGPKISLAYDKGANRIFWADEGTDRIESSDPYGQNRTLFRSDIISPVSLALVDNDLYWTSRRSAILSWTDEKEVAVNATVYSIDIGPRADVALLQSMDGFYTRGLHPCSQNNGDCSHICLVTNFKNRLCACPLNVALDSDMKTCKTKASHASDVIDSCSNGYLWIGLFVELLVFITFSVILYYVKIRKSNLTHSRNQLDDISIKYRSNNIESLSSSTIETS